VHHQHIRSEPARFILHVTEIVLAVQRSGTDARTHRLDTPSGSCRKRSLRPVNPSLARMAAAVVDIEFIRRPRNAYPTVYCSPLIPNGKLGAVPQGGAFFLSLSQERPK
jgi:hypothetical protein